MESTFSICQGECYGGFPNILSRSNSGMQIKKKLYISLHKTSQEHLKLYQKVTVTCIYYYISANDYITKFLNQ